MVSSQRTLFRRAELVRQATLLPCLLTVCVSRHLAALPRLSVCSRQPFPGSWARRGRWRSHGRSNHPASRPLARAKRRAPAAPRRNARAAPRRAGPCHATHAARGPGHRRVHVRREPLRQPEPGLCADGAPSRRSQRPRACARPSGRQHANHPARARALCAPVAHDPRRLRAGAHRKQPARPSWLSGYCCTTPPWVRAAAAPATNNPCLAAHTPPSHHAGSLGPCRRRGRRA